MPNAYNANTHIQWTPMKWTKEKRKKIHGKLVRTDKNKRNPHTAHQYLLKSDQVMKKKHTQNHVYGNSVHIRLGIHNFNHKDRSTHIQIHLHPWCMCCQINETSTSVSNNVTSMYNNVQLLWYRAYMDKVKTISSIVEYGCIMCTMQPMLSAFMDCHSPLHGRDDSKRYCHIHFKYPFHLIIRISDGQFQLS